MMSSTGYSLNMFLRLLKLSVSLYFKKTDTNTIAKSKEIDPIKAIIKFITSHLDMYSLTSLLKRISNSSMYLS